jgi:hypothetical protein
MNANELHAYLKGPGFSTVAGWIEAILSSIKSEKTFDLTKELGKIIKTFDGKSEKLTLESHEKTEWLELFIHTITNNSIFAGWDNITLGERLVDDLGGITLVECRGEYTHPLSDDIVRISREKVELVRLPNRFNDPFDESLTKYIRSR